jgi:hypothetical protein
MGGGRWDLCISKLHASRFKPCHGRSNAPRSHASGRCCALGCLDELRATARDHSRYAERLPRALPHRATLSRLLHRRLLVCAVRARRILCGRARARRAQATRRPGAGATCAGRAARKCECHVRALGPVHAACPRASASRVGVHSSSVALSLVQLFAAAATSAP